MITLPGTAENTMPLKEVQKQAPTRFIKLLRRLVALQRGRYVLLLNVGDDDISWTVADVGRIER